MESGFSMTEPHNPAPTPGRSTPAPCRDGDEWVINGHKWFTSNGIDADFFIVMCRAPRPARPIARRAR
jgi:acyl-CoA dehydrogenase